MTTPSSPGLKRSAWARVRAEAVRRLFWLWKPGLYAGVLFGFLMGRALPASGIVPLGLAFFSAVRGAGIKSLAALPVGIAVMAGGLTVLPLPRALWVGAAVWAAHFAATALGTGSRGSSPLGAALISAFSAAIASAPFLAAGVQTQTVLWIGVAGVLAPIFTLGVLDATSGGLFRGAVIDSPVPVVVLIAAALGGLDSLALFHLLPLQDVAAGLIILAFAYAGGPSLGAAAGAVLGVSFLLGLLQGRSPTDITPEAHSMAYVMAGLLAGTFRDLSRVGVGAAFFLGLVTFLAAAQRSGGLLSVVYAGAASVVLFWVIPRRWIARMPVSLLSSVGAGRTEEGSAGDPLTVADRVRGLSRVLREVSRAFLHVATIEAEPEKESTDVFDQVAARHCQHCSLNRKCWEKSFHRTYQSLGDLWSQIDSAGPLSVKPPPEELSFCIYPSEVASTLNYLHDLHRFRHQWERRVAEGRMVAGDYVKNTARILERFADEAGNPGERDRARPVIKVTSGIARLPKRGGQVSGDSYASAALSDHRHLLALSDGMGVGTDAAADSRQSIQLLQEVLTAGFSTELAVNTVNSVLLLRSGPESFVTIDMALLDLATGRVEFVKIGAAPSFIKRGDNVTLVKQAAVPVGIINQVVVEPEYRLLRHGDLLVMVTDGIWDVSKEDVDKERWILQQLGRETSSDPEEIAESLLARALELAPDAGDDMTVLVARIEACGRLAAGVKRPAPGNWVAARKAPKNQEKPQNRSHR